MYINNYHVQGRNQDFLWGGEFRIFEKSQRSSTPGNLKKRIDLVRFGECLVGIFCEIED